MSGGLLTTSLASRNEHHPDYKSFPVVRPLSRSDQQSAQDRETMVPSTTLTSSWPSSIWAKASTQPSGSNTKPAVADGALISTSKPSFRQSEPKPWGNRSSLWSGSTDLTTPQIFTEDLTDTDQLYLTRANVSSKTSRGDNERKFSSHHNTPRLHQESIAASNNGRNGHSSEAHDAASFRPSSNVFGTNRTPFDGSSLLPPVMHKPSSSFAGLPLHDNSKERVGRQLNNDSRLDDSLSTNRSGSLPPSNHGDFSDHSRVSQSYAFARAQGAIGSNVSSSRSGESQWPQVSYLGATANRDTEAHTVDLSRSMADMNMEDPLPSEAAFTASNIEELVRTPGFVRVNSARSLPAGKIMSIPTRASLGGQATSQAPRNPLASHVDALRRGYDPFGEVRSFTNSSSHFSPTQDMGQSLKSVDLRQGKTSQQLSLSGPFGAGAASQPEALIYQQLQQLDQLQQQQQQALLSSYQLPQYAPILIQQQQNIQSQIQLLQSFAQRNPYLSSQMPVSAIYGNSALQSSMAAPSGPRDRHTFQDAGSTLMQEFKSNPRHAKHWTLKNIAGHVVEFSGDRDSSKFIQEKMETAKSDDRAMVFEETQANILQLMVDRYGNYVIQKLFEFGSQAQKSALFRQMKSHVRELSLNQYGCRNVQKALEVLLVDQQVELINELRGHERECVWDQSGNHVVQVAIIRIPLEHITFILDAFQDQLPILATHIYGCRVVQRMLENWHGPVKQQIMNALWPSMEALIQDAFGNYVTQHIIEHNPPQDQHRVNCMILDDLIAYSKQKFASNVVEKSIKFGTSHLRRSMLDIILSPAGAGPHGNTLAGLIKDQFANYVIQRMIDELQELDYFRLRDSIYELLPLLRRSSFTKQVANIENALNKRRHRESVEASRYTAGNSAIQTPALAHDGPSLSSSPSLTSNSPVFPGGYKTSNGVSKEGGHPLQYAQIAGLDHSARP